MQNELYKTLTSILCLLEAFTDCPDCVASIRVSGHVFVDRLDADLKSGAAVLQHVAEMPLEAIVRSGLDGDSDALGSALLRIPSVGKIRFVSRPKLPKV